MIDTAIGNNIIVVEVFMTHMLSRPLASIKAPISERPLVPASRNTLSAIRRCRFQRCIANATMKPPRNRKITLFEYGAAVFWMLAMSSSGKHTSGSSAVTAIGTASVAHQIAISTPMAAVRQAASLSPSGAPAASISIADVGPSHTPIR